MVTRGFISCDFAEDQLASCIKPEIVGVVEVRPKIRHVELQPDVGTPEPTMMTAQEIKPVMSGRAVETPPEGPPSQISAQELKPVILTIKEED
ncbi:MAG: hypothetical protein AMJ46_14035 [Latescibacteria bacterium DG_63]|nr:MAG: hypothetical protein AMJ46_14035 [Latescibacteria bacterium DG_63]